VIKLTISKNGGCNSCGDKGTKINISFPVGVTKEFINACKAVGFIDYEQYTRAGLLYICKGSITISGALCLRNASILCSNKDSKICEKEIDNVIAILEKILNM
jgi:hypothetical protein